MDDPEPAANEPTGDPLPMVSTSDLSRRPKWVLDLVAQGKRVIVCWHKKPVATLQPLDGAVYQPLTGTTNDIYGWPVGDAIEEIEKLSRAERAILTDGYERDRIIFTGLWSDFEPGELSNALCEMESKGLVKKLDWGNGLTRRGIVLRQTLLEMRGVPESGRKVPRKSLWDRSGFG